MKIRNHKSKIKRCRKDACAPSRGFTTESGFTLIEIMVATVITTMIIGSVYTAFRTSLNVYQRDEAKIIMLQRCRVALDRIARDVSNLFYIADDEEMILLSEDFTDSETEEDKDMISFVAIVQPRMDNYYMALEESGELTLDEEEENPLPSDLARIIYYIGPSPEDETVQSLMRIETTSLDVEEFEELLEGLMSSSLTEEVMDELELEGVRSAALVDYVSGLNMRYFDGEEWIDLWDMEEEERLPGAVELTLSITDADTREKTLTQALVVYLPMNDVLAEDAGSEAAGAGMAQ